MPQLNPEFYISQIFWLAVIFTFLYCFVAFFFVPRIGTVVDKREKSVKDLLSESESIVIQQKEIKDKIQVLLDKARTEAAELRRVATKDTEISLALSIAKIEREMQRKISSAEEKLARYKSQIKSEIDSSADAVAKEILSQVLQHSEKKRKVAN